MFSCELRLGRLWIVMKELTSTIGGVSRSHDLHRLDETILYCSPDSTALNENVARRRTMKRGGKGRHNLGKT